MGAAAGLAVFIGFARVMSGLGLDPGILWAAELGIAVALSLVGVWASSAALPHLRSKGLQSDDSAGERSGGVGGGHTDDDPSEVVVDEFAGVWIALMGAATGAEWFLAFVLFRVFDIAKPYPVNRLEGLPGGLGIMADDLAAGLYAVGARLLLVHLWALL